MHIRKVLSVVSRMLTSAISNVATMTAMINSSKLVMKVSSRPRTSLSPIRMVSTRVPKTLATGNRSKSSLNRVMINSLNRGNVISPATSNLVIRVSNPVVKDRTDSNPMVNKVKTNLGRMDLLPIRVNPRSPDRTAKLASKVSSPNNRATKLNKTTNRVSKTVITPPSKLLKVRVSKVRTVKVNRDKVKVTLRVKDRDKVKDNKVTEKAVKGMVKVRVSPARAVTVLAARVVPVVSRLLVKV